MFLSQIWGTIIGKSEIDSVDAWGLTLSIATAGCIVNYGAYRGELALSSGVDDLLITQLSCHGLHFRITARTSTRPDGKQHLERAADSVA
jgi:hypothetical protein